MLQFCRIAADNKKILNLLFRKYFAEIEYNVQLFFVMDDAVRINETIYGSISDNLNNPIYTLNVQFLNESLNEQLHDKR